MGAMKSLFYEKNLLRKGGDDPRFSRAMKNLRAEVRAAGLVDHERGASEASDPTGPAVTCGDASHERVRRSAKPLPDDEVWRSLIPGNS